MIHNRKPDGPIAQLMCVIIFFSPWIIAGIIISWTRIPPQ
jgi:hypothetical protein